MSGRVYNVLFLCTGNSARSILAEALLDRLGAGSFRAFSAGSQPAGALNPYALALLERRGFEIVGLRSKHWSEFENSSAPVMDIVITVCDNTAAGACPVWPGRPVSAHWGLPDPAAAQGGERQIVHAFESAYGSLARRIGRLVELPLGDLDPAALETALQDLATADDAPDRFA